MSDENVPVRVVHLRNVTSEVTQADIMEAARQFGNVEKIVMLKTKHQAMVQFTTVAEATAFIDYYAEHHLRVGQRTIYSSYSRHSEIAPVCAPAHTHRHTDGNRPHSQHLTGTRTRSRTRAFSAGDQHRSGRTGSSS